MADASGGEAVLLATTNSRADATVHLAKGRYDVVVFLKADDSDYDAAYFSIGASTLRTYPRRQGRTDAGVVSLRAEVGEKGVYPVTVRAGEPCVIADRLELRRQ